MTEYKNGILVDTSVWIDFFNNKDFENIYKNTEMKIIEA